MCVYVCVCVCVCVREREREKERVCERDWAERRSPAVGPPILSLAVAATATAAPTEVGGAEKSSRGSTDSICVHCSIQNSGPASNTDTTWYGDLGDTLSVI